MWSFGWHVIRTQARDKEAFEKNIYAKRYVTSRKEKREVRHAADNLDFPITMYMYDQKLAIISSKEENFALLIQSPELSEMQKKIFNLLWGSLGKAGKQNEIRG